MLDKVPPHVIEIENNVLGSMMVHHDSCVIGLSQLNEETFYNNSNKCIFKSIKALNAKGSAVDLLTVCELLVAN